MLGLLSLAQGNPGALTFLMELISPENTIHSLPIAVKIDRIKSLRGTNLYVLYNDLCSKDMKLVAKLCEVCPDDVLEDACSRQDYSGRELVKPYLTQNKTKNDN